MSESSLSALFLQNPQLAIALRRRMEAEGQIKEGTSSEPIRSPWQGVNRLAQGLLGGYGMRKADEEMAAGMEADRTAVNDYASRAREAMAALLMGQQPQPGAQPAPTPAAPSGPAPSSGPGGPPIAATMLAPEAQAFLTGVYGAESPGYNVKYGGSTFDNFADHPRTPIPIMSGPMKGQYSTAAGRPQFLASTWDDVKTKYNLPDFSPVSQDMGAWHLATDTYKSKTGRDLLTDLRSNDPAVRAGIPTALAGVWPSLPGGNQQNPASNGFWNRYNAALGGQQQAPQQANIAMAATDPTGAQMPPGAPVNAPASVPRETPPAAMGGAPTGAAPAPMQPGAVPGIPTRPSAPGASALTQIYMDGLASPNPRVRAVAQGLAPFIKQETPNLTIHNVGGQMVAIDPRTGNIVRTIGPAESQVPLPANVEAQRRRLAGPTNVSPNNVVLDPVTNQPIYRAPPAPPSTFEEAAARSQSQGGQSATEFRSGQTQATESAQTIQKNMDEQSQRASAASGRLPMYDRALAGLDKMPPGALMDTRMRIAGLAQELGLNIGDVANLPEAQLRQAIARNLELVMTPKGQGQITESERALIRDQINIMLSTPEGTKQIIALAKANDTRDIERSGIYRKYIDQSGVIRDVAGLRKELSEYDAQAPWKGLMLPPAENAAPNAAPQQRQGQRPIISNPADAAKLPPGSEFQTPDGRILRVPMR